MPPNEIQRRRVGRKKTSSQVVRLQITDRLGNPQWVTADLLDTSEDGIGIALMKPLAIGSKLLIRAKLNENRNGSANGSANTPASTNSAPRPALVKWCTEQPGGTYHAGLELADHGSSHKEADAPPQQQPKEADIAGELDCYEILQVSPNADPDTINRVYRILAQRYHPDAPGTGNKEIFLKLCDAHRVLSDPERRARYDVAHREAKQLNWKIFDRAEAAKGPEAEQRKRRGILELLYAKTIHDPEHSAMSTFDFEQILGCPREHLEAPLWYLKGKGFVKRADNGRFTITVSGFDEVEGHSTAKTVRSQKLLEPAHAAEN